jgi:hypothetical protein
MRSVASAAILLEKALLSFISCQLGVEVFENLKIHVRVHSGVKECWADDSTSRKCTLNSNFLIVKWNLMQTVRVFGRPEASILGIHMAREMKPCLITREIQRRVQFTIHNLFKKPLAVLHTFLFISRT